MKATFLYMLRSMRLSIFGWGIGLAVVGALVVLGYETILENFKLIEQLMDDPPVAIIEGEQGRSVSRNAPCPCGSGKKYKRCHGKLNSTP